MSPGLYSAVEAMTSMPGAPVRSVRFCSTRCGESVAELGWAKSPVTTPAPKIAATNHGRADFLTCMVPSLGSECSASVRASGEAHVRDPVALPAREAVAHALAVEGDRRALEHGGIDVVQRVHADYRVRPALDVARHDRHDTALATYVEGRG